MNTSVLFKAIESIGSYSCREFIEYL